MTGSPPSQPPPHGQTRRSPAPRRPRPEPPGAWAASAAFGWRALLKIKHVPECCST